MNQTLHGSQNAMSEKVDNTRIFKNNFLELLTYTSFPLHVVFYGGISVLFYVLGIYYSNTSLFKGALIWVAALFGWTFLEYLLHRFVFHFVNENKYVQKFHFIFHGVHHDFPHEEKRTMMPPSGGTIFISLILLICYLIFGTTGFLVTGGIVFGYLCYSGLHYCIHMYKAPKFLQPLWTHHLLHHYQDDEMAFGVSNRFWDRVFNTMPKKK